MNRYVISNVYNILDDNIFVRTIHAGKINQHVGFECGKPWLISVKLSLIFNPDEGLTTTKQDKDHKCNGKLNSNVETKDQNVGIGVCNNIDGKDKRTNDSKDSLTDNNKTVREGVIQHEVIVSDVGVQESGGENINSVGLEVKSCEIKSKNIDGKKINKDIKPIEAISDVKYLIINFPIRKQIQLLSYSKIEVDPELPELSKADIVIAGGRSFGTEENFKTWLRPLAIKLGAAIGATRGAVELGCAPAELQIGSAGLIISPKLYIAFGISGSDHHMAGVKNAKTIIAINIDKDATIMSMADYYLTMDMFDVISGMTKWLDDKKMTNINCLIQNLDKNQFQSDEQEVKISTN
ncbi:Electron transfer flavoprotein large subunit [Candidatus Hodgkinia cicadicola]|uniref:Electron transfer flavoprotein large subunit n=1 Tax=Candidatus Hodgkinia cicadicola TaxID=573658 RepID=A0ABX4MEE8_9HYPH|nr:Electron transfer flavoprotein large subunit [Candidatus Hodgkinia cicadicola]